MPATDLCTLSDYKALAGTEASADDVLLSSLITSASQFIRTFTDRDFTTPSYTEIYDGTGGCRLFLANGPALSVTSLSIGTFVVPARAAIGQSGYFLSRDGNVVQLSGYSFCRGEGNVSVSYTVSTAIPSDIAQACKEMVAAAKARGKLDGGSLVEKSLGPDGNQTFRWSTADIPAATKAVLLRYQRVVPA